MDSTGPTRQVSPSSNIFGTPARDASEPATTESIRGYKRPHRDLEWEALVGRVKSMESAQQDVGTKVTELNKAMHMCASRLQNVTE